MHIVIRAGGTGSRLWPVSRRAAPKQFQNILGGETMIEQTIKRISPLVSSDNLWISINQSLFETAKNILPDFNLKHFIIEPEARNTGAAICLEACFLEQKIDPDEIIASLPSDDYISNEKAFRDLLSASEVFIRQYPDFIIAPAVKPDYPEVGYSYLKAGQRLDDGGQEALLAVSDVVEKPNREYCEELIESGIHYWHTGMYLWRLGRILELFEKLQPAMLKTCRAIVASENNEERANLYASLEKMSIESAITHRVDHIAMSVSNHVGWSDLGKWPAVKRLSETGDSDTVAIGKASFNKSSNSIVYNRSAKKLVVLNGVSNLAVIETDDALLISSLDSTEDIKEVLDELEKNGQENYL